jgi:hypothetical protein
MKSVSSGATTTPRRPDSRTKPCTFSRANACTTGWRETFSLAARSSWLMRVPAGSSPLLIASRIAS